MDGFDPRMFPVLQNILAWHDQTANEMQQWRRNAEAQLARNRQQAAGAWNPPAQNLWQLRGAGNMGDIVAQNLNIAASVYPHLWANAIAEQARRDREYRAALEQALRTYAAQSAWMWSPQFQYQAPAFW